MTFTSVSGGTGRQIFLLLLRLKMLSDLLRGSQLVAKLLSGKPENMYRSLTKFVPIPIHYTISFFYDNTLYYKPTYLRTLICSITNIISLNIMRLLY